MDFIINEKKKIVALHMSTNVFSMKVQILETLFFVSPTRDGTNILLGARAGWCFSICHTVTVLFFYP